MIVMTVAQGRLSTSVRAMYSSLVSTEKLDIVAEVGILRGDRTLARSVANQTLPVADFINEITAPRDHSVLLVAALR
jgi:hypothetical protein